MDVLKTLICKLMDVSFIKELNDRLRDVNEVLNDDSFDPLDLTDKFNKLNVTVNSICDVGIPKNEFDSSISKLRRRRRYPIECQIEVDNLANNIEIFESSLDIARTKAVTGKLTSSKLRVQSVDIQTLDTIHDAYYHIDKDGCLDTVFKCIFDITASDSNAIHNYVCNYKGDR